MEGNAVVARAGAGELPKDTETATEIVRAAIDTAGAS
jgi:hypothetical protein